MSVSIYPVAILGIAFSALAAGNVSCKKYGWATFHVLLAIFCFICFGAN